MRKIKLKTTFDFDSAHRLVGYPGACKNLHGHIWHVEVEIYGDDLDDVGMLFDFTHVKKIKDLFDHKTILWKCSTNHDLIYLLKAEKNEVYEMNANPTAENLCYEILLELRKINPNLNYVVRVYESPKSFSEVSSK